MFGLDSVAVRVNNRCSLKLSATHSVTKQINCLYMLLDEVSLYYAVYYTHLL